MTEFERGRQSMKKEILETIARMKSNPTIEKVQGHTALNFLKIGIEDK